MYHPHRDTVIFCDECNVWYHRDCLFVLGPLAGLRIEDPEALPNYLQELQDADSNEEIARWGRLLAIPIQRRYPGFLGDGFVTYESILLAIRGRWRRLPRNIDDFLRTQAEHATYDTVQEHLDVMKHDLDALEYMDPAARLVYRCPRKHML